MLSVDSGTWPTGGGGVGSCRRDLIDNLNRVRWTAVAEIGTDSEMVQKGYQVYMPFGSVSSLQLLYYFLSCGVCF